MLLLPFGILQGSLRACKLFDCTLTVINSYSSSSLCIVYFLHLLGDVALLLLQPFPQPSRFSVFGLGTLSKVLCKMCECQQLFISGAFLFDQVTACMLCGSQSLLAIRDQLLSTNDALSGSLSKSCSTFYCLG